MRNLRNHNCGLSVVILFTICLNDEHEELCEFFIRRDFAFTSKIQNCKKFNFELII